MCVPRKFYAPLVLLLAGTLAHSAQAAPGWSSAWSDFTNTLDRINQGNTNGCSVAVEGPDPISGYEKLYHPSIFGGKRQIFGKSKHSANLVLLTYAGADCTGTLISAQVVLTSAHCVRNRELGLLKANFIQNYADGSNSNQERKVSGVVMHPNYEEDRYLNEWFGDRKEPNDIALVFLGDPAPEESVALDLATNSKISAGCRYAISGFGAVSGDPELLPPEAQAERDALLDYVPGENLYSHGGDVMPANINPKKFGKKTLFSITGDVTGCRGDSGGPLFEKCAGAKVVKGVLSSAAFGCKQSTYTSVAPHLNWIQQEVAKFRAGRNI